MKKNYLKIALDIIIAIVFALLFNKAALGLTFHEIAGLAIGVAFILHKLLNAQWIKTVTKNIFSKKLVLKTRINYILDVLLLLCFTFILISGIFISKALFPSIDIADEPTFKALHISISYVTLMLIGIHIGLHWSWVIDKFKRMFNITQQKKVLSIISAIIVMAVFTFGSYSVYSAGYFQKVFVPETSLGSHFQGEHGSESLDRKHTEGFSENTIHQEEADGPEEGDHVPKGKGNGTGIGKQDGTGSGNGIRNFDSNISIQDAFNSLLTYLGIVSVFAILAYYIEKLLLRKKDQLKLTT